MTLKQALLENDSVSLRQSAKTWQEAIEICMKPLVKSGAVKENM